MGVNITQPLLRDFWTDATRTQIKVNRRQLKISELAFRFQVMDVVTRVTQAYYDLIFARENVKVQEKAVELANRLLFENQQRVKAGAMAPLDQKQAESQAAVAQADLISARNDLLTTENALKNLLTDDFGSFYNIRLVPTEKLVAVPAGLNLFESWQNGLMMRPDYNQLKQELEKANIILKYRYNQLFPTLDLVGSYGRNGLDSDLGGAVEDIRGGDFPKWSGGVVFSVPLSLRRERNDYKSAKAQQKQALLRLKKLENDVMVQIEDSVNLVKSNLERVDATRAAREFAEDALEAQQKTLEAGKGTVFVVLQLQRDLTAARSGEIRALSEYNKALNQLYFNEGTTLERNGVEIDVK